MRSRRPGPEGENRLSSLLAPGRLGPSLSRQGPEWRIGEPVALRRAAQRVDHAYPDIDPNVKEEDREQLVRELDRRQRADDWRNYTWADLQRAARALLQPSQSLQRSRPARWNIALGRSGGPLHQRREYRPLVSFLLDQVNEQAKPRFLRTMYRLYLSTFDRRSSLTQKLARRLDGCVQHTSLPIQRAVDLGVLQPESAAERLAERMTVQPSPFEFVKDIGIEAPHGEGLMAQVHERFVRQHRPTRLRHDQAENLRLLNWIAPPDAHPMEAGAELGIDALLAPWERSEPDQGLRKHLETTLIRGFGDPRITRTGVWSRCKPDARAVMMRWLAGETIEVFFEIISKAVTSHMWADRRGLWMELYRANRIHEAWFALSPRGEEVATRLRRSEDVPLAYGRNQSWNSGDRDKCLLVMTIDRDRVVVEGSHSFKTHIYRRGDRGSVALYENTYDCDDVRGHGRAGRATAFVHHSAWDRRIRAALGG
ncbi:MAG: hypothetical protein F4Y77_17780 [Holophagales bacterium]|nr:hypothetical protein [Holophagales bacterium]